MDPFTFIPNSGALGASFGSVVNRNGVFDWTINTLLDLSFCKNRSSGEAGTPFLCLSGQKVSRKQSNLFQEVSLVTADLPSRSGPGRKTSSVFYLDVKDHRFPSCCRFSIDIELLLPACVNSLLGFSVRLFIEGQANLVLEETRCPRTSQWWTVMTTDNPRCLQRFPTLNELCPDTRKVF